MQVVKNRQNCVEEEMLTVGVRRREFKRFHGTSGISAQIDNTFKLGIK